MLQQFLFVFVKKISHTFYYVDYEYHFVSFDCTLFAFEFWKIMIMSDDYIGRYFS